MKHFIHTKGFSLVEVLVAIAILMLAIVGPMTIAMKSLQSAQYARQQNTAFFLAQEGISIINTIRNDAGLKRYATGGVSADAWAWVPPPPSGWVSPSGPVGVCFTSSGCNIDTRDTTLLDNIADCSSASACTLKFDESAGRATYQLVSGDTTPYTRIITLTRVNNNEVLVRSRVIWDSKLLGGTKTVEQTTSLFNIFK